MSGAVDTQNPAQPIPEFQQALGHPRPLWMLFMTEFWERFAFYGIRWALVLYIVAQFYGGSGTGETPANQVYGAYLALVYAAAIFGGYVADRIIGYQRSILLGAVVMAAGLFMIALPDPTIFKVGLATIIAGNGLFKPNISTMVGKLYAVGDERRDSGFTLFYMGINLGAMASPLLTGALAQKVFGTDTMPAYKVVFITSGIGMLISLVWFWFGRAQLKGIGLPPVGGESIARLAITAICTIAAIPGFYFLLNLGADSLQWILTVMFIGLALLLLVEGIRNGPKQRDMVIAMLIIFAFNVLFWCFFEQATISFSFLADKIVNRDFGGWIFPVGWFQSVNSIAIVTLAPIMAWLWVKDGPRQSVDPAQVRPGLDLQRPGVPVADVRVVQPDGSAEPEDSVLDAVRGVLDPVHRRAVPVADRPVDGDQAGPGAPGRFRHGRLVPVHRHWQQPVGHLCQPRQRRDRHDPGSALSGYTFGFWTLLGFGVLLFLIAPLVQKLMHGVK